MTRLVPAPVFVLCPIRSGSTLLRCILNTHSRICAPHELHVADLDVELTSEYVRLAMDVAGLGQLELRHLMWDRVFHEQLTCSGKDILVDKTPGNLLLWQELLRCWPEARFIFLVRNPAHILASALDNRSEAQSAEHVTQLVIKYLALLGQARGELHGLTIRYEQLTTNPEETTQGVCDYLGVAWEPGMLDYGSADHGPFVFGIGDFTDMIHAGRIIPYTAPPRLAAVPDEVGAACQAWGYPTP